MGFNSELKGLRQLVLSHYCYDYNSVRSQKDISEYPINLSFVYTNLSCNNSKLNAVFFEGNIYPTSLFSASRNITTLA
jgi:hypothetical protein